MKLRDITPTQIERVLETGRYIVSTTDTKGRIVSTNDVLVEYSGFTREELIGAHHNIVRHPDMPRTVFNMAWTSIQSGDDFSGYIKNLCKDGSYYWVFAHILPQTNEDGDITGYRSVRRAPRREGVEVIIPVYAAMLAAEKAAGTKNAIAAGSEVLRNVLAARRQSYDQMVAML